MFIRLLFMVVLCLLAAGPLRASESGLNDTWSKVMLLSSTDAISAASFRTREGDHYSRYILPASTPEMKLSEALSLSGWARGSYFQAKSEHSSSPLGGGEMDLRWDTYAINGGGKITFAVTDRLHLHSSLGVGYIRMINLTRLKGVSSADRAILKQNGIIDWWAESLLVSPSIGGRYRLSDDNEYEVVLGVDASWNVQFPLTPLPDDDKQVKGAGIWSALAEYRLKERFRIADRQVDVVFAAQPGGFWGKGYRDMDFGFVHETSAAVEFPLTNSERTWRLRTGVGYLINDMGQGITFLLSLR
ncbi:hypothetical protein [Rahnella variigena]|uniref:hypothetical protein n=1 Tax=Rahnella variigena TaxID=574964 RepID=UPI0013301880|nr:hypothetical protein [Rahnella variigena]